MPGWCVCCLLGCGGPLQCIHIYPVVEATDWYLRPRVVSRCWVWINSRIRGSKQGVTNLSYDQTIFMTFWNVSAALKSQLSHQSGLNLRINTESPLWRHKWRSFVFISKTDDVKREIRRHLLTNQKRESARSMGWIYICIYINITKV